ncbi:ABC transporter permease [Amycolatopsis sp. BJA-103]|uniref:ABC transporter permease n=1 Tax=Amycolatopsis sp. BJA-103 TaxID=1911175 RepID=UPI000C789365|nr:ABC transporter permease [Amycolatopsis sp. BJA-103]AUI65014.1 ABC transporter permease [Amycolatopsis sp. BJA-103]PNE16215.1 ABC transporter permease [Amycolatopsis sp. BJA-103]
MNAISSEWTKFWSVRSTWWCLSIGVVLMLAYSGALGLASNAGVERSMAPHAVVTGAAFYLTQFAVVALAALFITSEYASGSIRSTLQWVPVRNRLLAAKSAVLLPVLFGYGVLNTLLGVAVSAPLIPERDSSVGDVLTTAAGMGGYFGLLGLLCLGLGTALRSTAGTLVTVFVLLVMVPMFAGSLGGEAILNYFPGFAGVNAMLSAGEPNPIFGGIAPYAPWVGIVLCTAWAAAGLAAGSTVLRRRDA